MPRPTLPAIPAPGKMAPERIDHVARSIIAWVARAADIDEVNEARARALALEGYLEQRDPANLGPMRWAARQIEKRIGQLLGPVSQGERTDLTLHHAAKLPEPTPRKEFRLMARYADAWDPCPIPHPAASHRAVLRLIDEYRETIGDTRREERIRRDAAARPPGSATIALADAIDWLDAQPRGAADLLLTDPPYSTAVRPFAPFVRRWVPAALACLAPSGRAYITIGAYPDELLTYLEQLASSAQWQVADVLVWTFRNTLGPSGAGYMPNWHAILHVVGPETPPLAFTDLVDRFSVFDILAPDGRRDGRLDAWEKPGELADRLVRHAGPVERVLDPFAGTGTFLLAAARAGATATGCDEDPAKVALCEARGIAPHEFTRPS